MLRFMLELEERLSIQIDFDALEYSYLNSIQDWRSSSRRCRAARADQRAMNEVFRASQS
jgi:hypothetical protein